MASLAAVSEKIAIAPVVCNLFALRAWELQNKRPAFTISVDVNSGSYDGMRRMVVGTPARICAYWTPQTFLHVHVHHQNEATSVDA
jgi:hypothetical protein